MACALKNPSVMPQSSSMLSTEYSPAATSILEWRVSGDANRQAVVNRAEKAYFSAFGQTVQKQHYAFDSGIGFLLVFSPGKSFHFLL